MLTLPVLIHLPHASRHIPDEHRGAFLIDAADLDRELLAHTDRYTDELFDLPGTDRLVFPVSRLIVDPERFRDDSKEVMAAQGLGAIYEKTHDGRPLKRIENREALLRALYDPHHRRLEEWTDLALERCGKCLILDAHSFPSRPMPCDLDQTTQRPDICIGTDPFHTPTDLTKQMAAAFQSQGWTVEVDRPYRGTITPASRFGVDSRVGSIMVEINRRLYMDEQMGAKLPTFEDSKNRIQIALNTAICAWP